MSQLEPCNNAVEPPANWEEARRRRARELLRKGRQRKDIAEALSIAKGAARQWGKQGPRRRRPGFTPPQAPCGPAKLPDEQRRQQPDLLAQASHREFGASYDLAQAGHILQGMGRSPQQPARRAAQRDEAAVARWRAARFPALKTGLAKGGTVLWADASGFYLLPERRRAWAPTAHPPVVQRQTAPCQSVAVIGFLQQLPYAIQGKLPVIWDGTSLQRNWAVREFQEPGAARRLRLERLPGDAPGAEPG